MSKRKVILPLLHPQVPQTEHGPAPTQGTFQKGLGCPSPPLAPKQVDSEVSALLGYGATKHSVDKGIMPGLPGQNHSCGMAPRMWAVLLTLTLRSKLPTPKGIAGTHSPTFPRA